MNRSLQIIPLSFMGVLLSLGCQTREIELALESHPSPNLPGAPEIKNISVLRPYFQTTLGNVDVGSSVGTAFLVELDGYDRPVVLTALSILGPASGLSRQASPTELSEIYQSITLGDAFGSFDGVLSSTGFLSIPESAPFDQPSPAGDILAISMPVKTRAGKFKLSSVLPVKGDTVWLSAAMFAGAPPSQRQHSAIVTGEDENGNIIYEFDDNGLTHQGTVGAPIMNNKGEVVAIHLGGSKANGKLSGFANPTSRFLTYLQAALSSSPIVTITPPIDSR